MAVNWTDPARIVPGGRSSPPSSGMTTVNSNGAVTVHTQNDWPVRAAVRRSAVAISTATEAVAWGVTAPEFSSVRPVDSTEPTLRTPDRAASSRVR